MIYLETESETVKKILNQRIFICFLVIFSTSLSSCTVTGTNTTIHTSSAPAVAKTNAASSTSTIYYSVPFTTASRTTDNKRPALLTASEIVDASGNAGFLFSEPARIGLRVSSTMRIYDWVPELIQAWIPGEVYGISLTLLEVMSW